METDQQSFMSLVASVAAIDKSLAVLVERLTDYPQIRERVINLEKIVTQLHAAHELRQSSHSQTSVAIIAALATGLASVGLTVLAKLAGIG